MQIILQEFRSSLDALRENVVQSPGVPKCKLVRAWINLEYPARASGAKHIGNIRSPPMRAYCRIAENNGTKMEILEKMRKHNGQLQKCDKRFEKNGSSLKINIMYNDGQHRKLTGNNRTCRKIMEIERHSIPTHLHHPSPPPIPTPSPHHPTPFNLHPHPGTSTHSPQPNVWYVNLRVPVLLCIRAKLYKYGVSRQFDYHGKKRLEILC